MAYKEWMFAVHDSALGQNRMGKNTTGWINICTAGAATSPTVYTNERGSATLTATNTIAVTTITNGYVRFWLDSSVASIDVSFLTATGECGMAKGVTPSTQHILVVNSQSTEPQTLWVPFAFIASTAVVDTTLDLPADLEILDAGLLVKTLDASATVDFGFINAVESGDEDGLLDGMVLDNAGLVTANGVLTGGSNIDYVLMTGGIYGVLLSTVIAGADAVATVGGITRRGHLTNGTIKSLAYTPSSCDTAEGFLSLTYRKAMG